MKRRIFFSDDGTLSDLSVNMQNYYSGTSSFSLVAADDAFYVGSSLPFNHLYIKMDGTNVNAETSAMSVSYWDSGAWRDAIEVIDETAVSGASLAQSGFVSWVPDRDYGWIREDTNYGGNSITGLTSVEIYDLYWLKITFSADLTADAAFSWIGQKFSDDDVLGSEYPDIISTSMLSAWETGKTTWEEQHIRAADIIVHDLISRKLIVDSDQILNRHDFELASVSKVAELVYTNLGDDYRDDKTRARKEYENRLNKSMPAIDKNRNARVDDGDQQSTGKLYR